MLTRNIKMFSQEYLAIHSEIICIFPCDLGNLSFGTLFTRQLCISSYTHMKLFQIALLI